MGTYLRRLLPRLGFALLLAAFGSCERHRAGELEPEKENTMAADAPEISGDHRGGESHRGGASPTAAPAHTPAEFFPADSTATRPTPTPP